jgi:hypothetical protein
MYRGKSGQQFGLLLSFSKTAQSKQSLHRQKFALSGTDVIIFYIFSPKKISFFDSKQSRIMQNFDLNIGFLRKMPIFSPKIVEIAEILIITSTPGHPGQFWPKFIFRFVSCPCT